MLCCTPSTSLPGRFIVGIGSNGESSYSLGDDDGEDFHQLTSSEYVSRKKNSG